MSSPVLYHGSPEELEELEGASPGYSGSLGWGLYLTSDPEFAQVFGDYLHEVESPVPPELVALIDTNHNAWTYDCGDSLVMGTPGSSPFGFDIVDLSTGQKHRYSVPENCEEAVHASLRADVFADAVEKLEAPTDPLEMRLWTDAVEKMRVGDKWGEAVAWDDALDAVKEEFFEGEDGTDEEIAVVEAAGESISDQLQELETAIDDLIGERIGMEIALDDISRTAEGHGYSAFWIDGYSPGGDEYVIVDERYLPLPVKSVERTSARMVHNPPVVRDCPPEIEHLVDLVRASLSDELRRPQYQGLDPIAGHCAVASEALYHLLGGKEAGWVPKQVRHEGDSHWFLIHRGSGCLVDATADQFCVPVSYEEARGRGFQTKQPSKRAQVLIDRVLSARVEP